MSNAKQVTSFFKAAQKGNLKKIKSLLKKGVVLEARDEEGRTILHVAAENDRAEVVKVLLELKINLDIQDNLGQTALYRAVIARKEPMAFLLIRNGANSDIPTRHGHTIWDKTDQYLSKSATQRMRSEAAIQRTKQPRVYYYQEPSTTTAKWGDRVVNIGDSSSSSSSSSSFSSSVTSSPVTSASPSFTTGASATSTSPIPPRSPAEVALASSTPAAPVPMPNLQPSPPLATRPSSTVSVTPLMSGLSLADNGRSLQAGAAYLPPGEATGYQPAQLGAGAGNSEDSYDLELSYDAGSAPTELESAAAEMTEALSHLTLGAVAVPFGEHEVMTLNASLISFSSALKALKRTSQLVGGDPLATAQRVMQSLSGLSLLLRQLNSDINSVTPLRNLGDMVKRATHAINSLQIALVLHTGAETATAVQETALATKALLQAALQPSSDLVLLKATRLAATNVINLMREVHRSMIKLGHDTARQEEMGEIGWTIGRIMEAVIISAKVAYANQQDQTARANLGALARALAEQYHKLAALAGAQDQPPKQSGGGDESAHFSAALRQLAAASARLASPAPPLPPAQPREKQAAALIAQVTAELNNNVSKALVEPIDPGRVVKGVREAAGLTSQIVCMALVTANALAEQEPTLAAQIHLASKTAAYFITQLKLTANMRALRVSDARTQLGLAHAVRALSASLVLLAETRLF